MFRRRVTALAVVVLGLGTGACLSFDPYSCTDSAECILDGAPGVCQVSGYCSYPDTACVPSGLRYEDGAGDGLGGQCVDPAAATGTTDPTTSGPTGATESSGEASTSTSTTLGPTTNVSETDPQTGTSTGDACGGAGEACCPDDLCDAGLACFAGQCSCVAAIAAGTDHSCLTTTEGALWCWGDNTYGQLGSAVGTFSNVPVEVPSIFAVDGTAVMDVAASRQTCAVGADGSASCWGANELRQAAPADINPSIIPTPLVFGTGFELVAAGDTFSCTLSGDSLTVSCFGDNTLFQLGTIEVVNGPNSFDFANVVEQIGAGDAFGCARVITGQVYCWGGNTDGQLAAEPGTLPASAALRQMPTPPALDLAVGRRHACALSAAGAVECWGRNDVGQAGDGLGLQVVAPTAVAFPAGTVEDLTGGPDHTCVLMSTGELYCWGSNAGGQLLLTPDAMGFDAYALAPVLVDVGGLEIESIVGGTRHACIMTTGHDVYCWGPNTAGQAGTGTPGYVFAPAPIDFSCG